MQTRWINLPVIMGLAGCVTLSADVAPAHWSVQPVRPPSLAQSVITHNIPDPWRDNPVDVLLVASLNEKGLTPVSLAGKRVLIRRATFDLTGLPPASGDVEAFLADNSPTAFESLIERLVASPQYGERWGRHWLDLVRYADTAGDGADFPVPEAYKYRNYVIAAFNADKPYDEFVREQIAGDLLPFECEEEQWEQTVATGYLAISRRIGVSPLGLRHITLEDTLDNLGKTFLGLSVGCARCHDHKFDTIPTEDYYALYGIFDSSVFPHPGEEHRPHRQDFVYRLGKDEALDTLKPFLANLEPWNRREREQFEYYRSFQHEKKADPTETREKAWRDLAVLRAERAVVANTFPDLEIAYAITEGEGHDAHVMKAGDPAQRARGEQVRRGFLTMLGGQKLPDDAKGSGRRELADWIADPNNPLTARVIVNRIWHHHFGRGLVASTSDFGVRGEGPTHPGLLDFLANHFVAHDWSVKTMHRLIMSSRAYQLANTEVAANEAIDPDNHYLWRANRRRLDAEQLRDSLLALGGELDLTPGGRHPFPHHLTYFYRQHEPFQEEYPTRRRSVYMMQQRIQKNVEMDLFDGSDGNLHCSERKQTTTALQALYAMNSKFLHERAAAVARRLLDSTGPDTVARVEQAYEWVYCRPPSSDEIDRAQTHLRQATDLLSESGCREDDLPLLAWSSYMRGMLGSNEFMFVD